MATELLWARELVLEPEIDWGYLIVLGHAEMITLNTHDWQRSQEHQALRNGHGFGATGRSILVAFEALAAPTTHIRLEVHDRRPECVIDDWDLITTSRMDMVSPGHLTACAAPLIPLEWPSELQGLLTFRFHARGFQTSPAPTTWLLQAWPHIEGERLGKLKGLHLDAADLSTDRAEAHRLLQAIPERDLPRLIRTLHGG